jgi:hypothetical protein
MTRTGDFPGLKVVGCWDSFGPSRLSCFSGGRRGYVLLLLSGASLDAVGPAEGHGIPFFSVFFSITSPPLDFMFCP